MDFLQFLRNLQINLALYELNHFIKVNLSLSNYWMETKNFQTCDDSIKPSNTLSKYIAVYKERWKFIAKFFSQFQGCGIKIARVIYITKPINFLQYLKCHSSECDIIMSHSFLWIKFENIYLLYAYMYIFVTVVSIKQNKGN